MNELKNILINLTDLNIKIEETIDKLTVFLGKNNIEEMNKTMFKLNGFITEHNQKTSHLDEYMKTNGFSKIKEILDKIEDENEYKELESIVNVYSKSVEKTMNKVDVFKTLVKISMDMINAVSPTIRNKIDFLV